MTNFGLSILDSKVLECVKILNKKSKDVGLTQICTP